MFHLQWFVKASIFPPACSIGKVEAFGRDPFLFQLFESTYLGRMKGTSACYKSKSLVSI